MPDRIEFGDATKRWNFCSTRSRGQLKRVIACKASRANCLIQRWLIGVARSCDCAQRRIHEKDPSETLSTGSPVTMQLRVTEGLVCCLDVKWCPAGKGVSSCMFSKKRSSCNPLRKSASDVLVHDGHRESCVRRCWVAHELLNARTTKGNHPFRFMFFRVLKPFDLEVASCSQHLTFNAHDSELQAVIGDSLEETLTAKK